MDGLTQSRIRTRDAALRLLNRLTTGMALGAIAALGVLSAVSAYTIPGTTAATTTTPASTSSSSTASTFAPSSLQSSTTPITPSSSPPVVVSGGSH
jgi:hypothetical protein